MLSVGEQLVLVTIHTGVSPIIVRSIELLTIRKIGKTTLNCGKYTLGMKHFRKFEISYYRDYLNNRCANTYAFFLPGDEALRDLTIKYFDSSISIERTNIAKMEDTIKQLEAAIKISREKIEEYEREKEKLEV